MRISSTTRRIPTIPEAKSLGAGIFTAITLFKPSDKDVATYINVHETELSHLTSRDLIVILPENVLSGDTAWMDEEFGGGNRRFPDLKRSDLPCLWIEDGMGGNAVIPLHQHKFSIGDVFEGVTDAVAGAENIHDFERAYNSWIAKQGLARSEFA